MRTRLLAVAIAIAATACGGDDGGSPTSPSQQPFNQTMTGTVSAFGTVRHPLSITRGGNMTVRLSWQDPVVDLDLFLSANACTQLYPKPACGILAGSDAGIGIVNEQIARTVTTGDSFQVWVDNLHLSRPQNYTIQLTIQ